MDEQGLQRSTRATKPVRRLVNEVNSADVQHVSQDTRYDNTYMHYVNVITLINEQPELKTSMMSSAYNFMVDNSTEYTCDSPSPIECQCKNCDNCEFFGKLRKEYAAPHQEQIQFSDVEFPATMNINQRHHQNCQCTDCENRASTKNFADPTNNRMSFSEFLSKYGNFSDQSRNETDSENKFPESAECKEVSYVKFESARRDVLRSNYAPPDQMAGRTFLYCTDSELLNQECPNCQQRLYCYQDLSQPHEIQNQIVHSTSGSILGYRTADYFDRRGQQIHTDEETDPVLAHAHSRKFVTSEFYRASDGTIFWKK